MYCSLFFFFFFFFSTAVEISSNLDLLSAVSQPRANTLTVTWSPLPFVPTGLEEHYFYIIEIRKSTYEWSDRDFTQTFQHQSGVTQYNEDVNVELEPDTTYAVRLVGKRVHQDQEERVIVSRGLDINITCTGWYTYKSPPDMNN